MLEVGSSLEDQNTRIAGTADGKHGLVLPCRDRRNRAAGMPLTLIERHQPQWTVERANRVMHLDKDDLRAAAELAAVPTLAESWQTTLTRRVERNINPDSHKRLFGENDS